MSPSRRLGGRGPLCVRLTWVPSPRLGLSPRYLRFSRGVGLETRPSPIHPTSGMNVASLVCDLASLSVWWRHGEWAPFPSCLLAHGLRRSPAAPPPPPFPPLQGAQPMPSHCPWRQVPASMAFVTDSNRPQLLWQPPPTACLTASEAAAEVPSLPMHPYWSTRRVEDGI